MKLCTILIGVVALCALSYALETGPVLTALQPRPEDAQEVLLVDPATNRQKRGLLLGAAALGLGVLGAGALVGAKVGFVGGAIAGGAVGRSYGGWGYGGYGGYGGYHYRGGWGYGGGYYKHGYGGYYRSYPTYIVDDEW